MLNEQFFPSPAGLQGLCPGPLAGDTGQYANLRFYWKLENRYGGGEAQGWDKTNGYFYQNGAYANSLSWTGGPGLTNQEFVLQTWHDADNDRELDEAESRRGLYVKLMDNVEVEQLVFVPLNATITLPITVQPSIPYTLILSRASGTNGWATFADGTRTQQVQGSTSVTIRGTEMSSALKNMRLRAVTTNSEPVESSEIFHRDFTVGQIQIQVCDEWNGRSLVSLPLANPANAVTVVPPGDYVYLRAVGVPTALEQSFGWQVGTNAPVTGAYLALTSAEAAELLINLTIDDPQTFSMKIGFPMLVGVEGHDTMAPSGPSATATVYPAAYSSWATMEYKLLEIYHAASGYADGGRYRATAYLFTNSASVECTVWPEQQGGGGGIYILQNPGAPCAVYSVISFTLFNDLTPIAAHHWSGSGVPGNATNTPYCSVGPIGPGNFSVTAHVGQQDYVRNYSTYADQVQSLSCSTVTVVNGSGTLYIPYDQHPGVTAVKFYANCAWNTWLSGPVENQSGSGNTLTGTLNLPAPGSYDVSVSKGGKTLTLDVKGINVEFEDNDPLNLPWTQDGYHDMNNDLAGDIYSPAGLIWSGGPSNNGVLYFGSNGASYNVHVVSSNLSSCYDDKTVSVLKVELNIWNGGSDLDNGQTAGSQGSQVADADEENVGAYLLVNWDDDDADGVMNANGTWTTLPVPDLTENSVANEDNLAKLKPSFEPLIDTGTAELEVSGTDAGKVKLWTQNTKGTEITLTSNKKTWNLANSSEKADFQSFINNGYWIEGTDAGTAERGVTFTLRYKDSGGAELCNDICKATVIMINLANAVYRDNAWPLIGDRGHGALVWRYAGACTKSDLTNDVNFILIEMDGPTNDRDLTTITQQQDLTRYGCFRNPAISYVQRLRIISAARLLVTRANNIAYSAENTLEPVGWNGDLDAITALRCDGLIEACYEINGVDVWGMERDPDNHIIKNKGHIFT